MRNKYRHYSYYLIYCTSFPGGHFQLICIKCACKSISRVCISMDLWTWLIDTFLENMILPWRLHSAVHFGWLSLISYSFYKSNYVQRFHYSRPVRKGSIDPENEFAVSIPIWDILCVYNTKKLFFHDYCFHSGWRLRDKKCNNNLAVMIPSNG